MNIKQIAALYDRLYDKADKLFKKHNLCDMTEEGCRGGKWAVCSCSCNVPGLTICPHFRDPEGCTARMLWCKLRYCWYVRDTRKFDSTLKQLDKMKRVMDRYHIKYGETREQMVKRKQKNRQLRKRRKTIRR